MAPPLVLHGAHQASLETIAGHAERYLARLRSYPEWPGLRAGAGPDCALPLSDRPPRSLA